MAKKPAKKRVRKKKVTNKGDDRPAIVDPQYYAKKGLEYPK